MWKKSLVVLFCVLFLSAVVPFVLAQDEEPVEKENATIERLEFENDAGFELRSILKIPAGEAEGKLGTKTNPIRCCKPDGEREYLSRLRDADGQKVTFSRKGSVGLGVYGHILDLYIVVDSKGNRHEIFMDMYFTKLVDEKPVEGFTLKNNEIF